MPIAGEPIAPSAVGAATATISHHFDFGAPGGGRFDHDASLDTDGRRATLTVSSEKVWGGILGRARGTIAGMPRNTGFPVADAQTDFLRARRQQVLAKLARRLVREPDDVNMVLPFEWSEEIIERLRGALTS